MTVNDLNPPIPIKFPMCFIGEIAIRLNSSNQFVNPIHVYIPNGNEIAQDDLVIIPYKQISGSDENKDYLAMLMCTLDKIPLFPSDVYTERVPYDERLCCYIDQSDLIGVPTFKLYMVHSMSNSNSIEKIIIQTNNEINYQTSQIPYYVFPYRYQILEIDNRIAYSIVENLFL